jgi:hypothetical protein
MSDRSKKWLQNMMSSNLASFWGTMTRNWILKVICFILAFAVWQVIRASTSNEKVVSGIPLIITAGNGYAVLDQSCEAVSIKFRGSLEDVSLISRDQISIEVDISDRAKLRQTLKFSSKHVNALSRAHPVQFDPPEVTVTIDREVEMVA